MKKKFEFMIEKKKYIYLICDRKSSDFIEPCYDSWNNANKKLEEVKKEKLYDWHDWIIRRIGIKYGVI